MPNPLQDIKEKLETTEWRRYSATRKGKVLMLPEEEVKALLKMLEAQDGKR